MGDLEADGAGQADGFFQPRSRVTCGGEIIYPCMATVGGAIAPPSRRKFRVQDAGDRWRVANL